MSDDHTTASATNVRAPGENQEGRFELERLALGGYLANALRGIGGVLGLGLLWFMEAVRNRFFDLLDRLNVKPRKRRASPFPPGMPRKRLVSAERR
ncbi:MAG: hypothetical protein M1336_03450 [Deltaproteobacteria bacterium]|jgi:hypothetical protein|nr:hypothetical protein [Deltaproteobacteria bacterium]